MDENVKSRSRSSDRPSSKIFLYMNNENNGIELETVNKLYLELSQITTAKTAKQIDLEGKCFRRTRLLERVYNEEELTPELMSAIGKELMGLKNTKECEGKSKFGSGSV
jgi:hypothetical protein